MLPAKKTTPSAYKKLVADIVRLYAAARRTLAKIYWQTGQWIVEVEQDGAVRARYGDALLESLSGDLTRRMGRGFSVKNLERMRGFYLEHPKSSASTKLTWSQQVELLPARTAKLRTRLEKKAIREGLTSRQIRALVRAKSRPRERSPLVPIQGKTGIYRIVKIENKLQWDKGFASYRELSEDQIRIFKDGDFVQLKEARLEKVTSKPANLYTYDADLIRAIDADTFWMRVWVARPDWRKEKLRLRGIDSPELNKAEGKAAKRFVEELFEKTRKITVTTTKPDKYHRYLSDVFLAMPDGREIFLNNHLLETAHAIRTDEIPLTEWEKE